MGCRMRMTVADKDRAWKQTRFTYWQRTLESNGLKIDTNKTEAEVCSKTNETLMVRARTENLLEQSETSEQDVKIGVKVAWQKWKG